MDLHVRGVDDSVWRRARGVGIHLDLSAGEVVQVALELWLSHQDPRIERVDEPAPRVPLAGGELAPGRVICEHCGGEFWDGDDRGVGYKGEGVSVYERMCNGVVYGRLCNSCWGVLLKRWFR